MRCGFKQRSSEGDLSKIALKNDLGMCCVGAAGHSPSGSSGMSSIHEESTPCLSGGCCGLGWQGTERGVLPLFLAVAVRVSRFCGRKSSPDPVLIQSYGIRPSEQQRRLGRCRLQSVRRHLYRAEPESGCRPVPVSAVHGFRCC